MNRLRREEELKRITEENRKLHEAILNVKPVMSNAQLQQDYNKH